MASGKRGRLRDGADAADAALPPADLDAPFELLRGPGEAYITGVTLPVDGGHLCRAL